MANKKDLFSYDRELRSGDDYRLPESLLTVQEYLESVRLMEQVRQIPANNYEMSNSKSRFFALYSHLKRCYDRHQVDPDKAGRCVFCGNPIPGGTDRDSQRPFCAMCQDVLANLEIPNTQNTRGYRHWGRFCCVCHKNPVSPSCNGMCASCYKYADNVQRNYLWDHRSELLPEYLLTRDQKDPEVIKLEKKYLVEHKRELLPPELNADASDPDVIRRFRVNVFSKQLIQGDRATPMDLRNLIGDRKNNGD